MGEELDDFSLFVFVHKSIKYGYPILFLYNSNNTLSFVFLSTLYTITMTTVCNYMNRVHQTRMKLHPTSIGYDQVPMIQDKHPWDWTIIQLYHMTRIEAG